VDRGPRYGGSGKFALKNAATGKCIDVYWRDWTLMQWTCDGSAGQWWRLQLADPNDPFSERLVYDKNGACMDLFQDKTYAGAWVGIYDCNNQRNQHWGISNRPGNATYVEDVANSFQPVKDFAMTAGLAFCKNDSSRCAFDATSQTLAVADSSATCISQLYKLPDNRDGSAQLTLRESTGWDNTVGASVTASLEAGVSFIIDAKMTVSVTGSYSHSWTGEQGKDTTMGIQAEAGDYVWFTRNVIHRQVVGSWVFNRNQGDQWTVPTSITEVVPVAADGDETFIAGHASKTRPSGLGCPS
jgi:hypothetical protein